ncbi:MAG: response regulator, partial [Gammaproteobacteria bacterium]|nr:response regulator [Gammaproteobacteria bacterium]
MDSPFATEILQSINSGLLVINDEQKIVFANRWFLEAIDHLAIDIDGTEVTLHFPYFKKQRLQSALTSAIKFGVSSLISHSIHRNIFPLRNRKGVIIDHTVFIRSLHWEEASYAIIQLTDVTSSIKREHSLHKAQQEAVQASQAKEEFLATMSHELRTPLTTIIGSSEILLEKEQSPDERELIKAIETAGRGQLFLINDILDMSKIESGKFTIHKSSFDLSHLLKEIQRMLSVRAIDNGIELIIEQPNAEKYLLIGDGQRVGQILINLLGNAIKFTEQGSVPLCTEVVGDQLTFRVEDSGIGMTQETMDKLFQRFEQADQSISRRFGGTGLGLFISRNLAELMGGTIEVSSQMGVGSSFLLTLPYSPSNYSIQQEKEPHNSASVLRDQFSGHVLIAEDTPELQLLQRRILERLGITVTTAANGREAVEQATAQPFDLILMDMQMPVMSGIEATQTLRSEGIPVPIVALTANVMAKHREAFESAGCDDFLAKPIDRQELMRVLKKYLK